MPFLGRFGLQGTDLLGPRCKGREARRGDNEQPLSLTGNHRQALPGGDFGQLQPSTYIPMAKLATEIAYGRAWPVQA
eukprot:3057333-Heterocapsa_arctica.AAC.1